MEIGDNVSHTVFGLAGAGVGALGAIIVAWMNKPSKDVALQEAANSAVKVALDGYKKYIETMTASYEARIVALTHEYETRITDLCASYEARIAGLTTEIHSLREEIKLFSVRQTAAAVAATVAASLAAAGAGSTPAAPPQVGGLQ